MSNKPPRQLCLLRLSAIGDVCHTLPVVRTLQDQWPETHITWVVGKLEYSLLEGLDGIELLPFDKKGGFTAYRQLWSTLGDKRFDALLHMQVALRASIATLGIKADRRIGFDRARARDFQWLFTDQTIEARQDEHVMDGLFGFARTLGIEPGQPRWDIPLSDADKAFAEKEIPQDQRTLVISPCSSQRARNFRNWPVENYCAVAEHAERELGMKVIITGGPSELEKEYGEAISDRTGAFNLVGKTTLKQLCALLGRATTLVSPDSGPVHMANAMGTPVVGLYATSNPNRTGPYFNRDCVVNRYPKAVIDACHVRCPASLLPATVFAGDCRTPVAQCEL